MLLTARVDPRTEVGWLSRWHLANRHHSAKTIFKELQGLYTSITDPDEKKIQFTIHTA